MHLFTVLKFIGNLSCIQFYFIVVSSIEELQKTLLYNSGVIIFIHELKNPNASLTFILMNKLKHPMKTFWLMSNASDPSLWKRFM